MATVIKLVPRLAWDGGALLIESFAQDGRVQWRVGPAIGTVVGLSRSANNGYWGGQSHGIYFSNGLAQAHESGVLVGPSRAFSVDDLWAIRVRRGIVTYEILPQGATVWTVLYTSAKPAPALPVGVDCAMYAPGDSVWDADYLTMTEVAALLPEEGGEPGADGIEAANAWSIIGFGAEVPATAGIAANTWRIVQDVPLESGFAPDSVTNTFLPFVGLGVDAGVGAFAVNQLPFFTNQFSFQAAPDAVMIENQYWIVDSITAGYDYAPTITNSLRPFLAFGSQDANLTWARNFLQPLYGFGSAVENNVRFRLYLPTLSGFYEEIGANGSLGYALWPRLQADGWGYKSGDPSFGEALFPTLVASGSGAGAGEAIFPTLIALGDGVAVPFGEGEALWPTLVADGSGLGGAIGEGEALWPSLVVSGNGIGPSSGEAWFPSLVASGTAIGGGVGSGTAWFPRLGASGTGLSGGVGDGVAVFPLLVAAGDSGGQGQATWFRLVAFGEGVGPPEAVVPGVGTVRPPVLTAYLVNVTTGALTAMPALDGVIGLVQAHGTLYGRKADGTLVAFDVPATALAPVLMEVRTAADSFQTYRRKRLDKLYFVVRSAGGLEVDVIVDETEVWPYTTPADILDGYGPHKMDVGRGPQFTTAALRWRNIAGVQADVGEVRPLVTELSKRPR